MDHEKPSNKETMLQTVIYKAFNINNFLFCSEIYILYLLVEYRKFE